MVNNERAYAYARWAGLTWLSPCDPCDVVELIVGDGSRFQSPVLDPAPWYDPDDPDTWGFLGVVGLEVHGDQDSTRRSNVSMGLSGQGIIGPQYMAPREMTVRALALAQDECSLSRGLLWLRGQYGSSKNPCGGDPMTYFDCCPCVCEDDETPGGPCWAHNYLELRSGPSCDPQWWPATYADVIAGPPAEDEEWCDWPDIYRQLRTGPPAWSCCIDQCVVPYMRQFHNTRVTAGPTILRHPEMSCGSMVEIEFTIVAADPVPHGMPFMAVREWIGGQADDELVTDPEPEAAQPDPFAAVA